MKNKKLTVTVGIPAYNEEKNIAQLIKAILQQKEEDFKIKKIIILSDCSTDKTDEKVLKIKDSRIALVRNIIRKGQVFSQNTIFLLSNSDIVVILEADTIPSNNAYLQELLAPMIRDKTVGLVEGYWKPVAPTTFLEKILHFQIECYRDAIHTYPNVDNWLFAGRGGKAFRRDIYKVLVWPLNVPEDIYAHVWCKANKIKTKLVHSATTYYRMPQSLNDAIRERRKFALGRCAMYSHFLPEILDSYYRRPFGISVKTFIRMLIQNVLYCLCYLALKPILSEKTSELKFTDLWTVTPSTKKVIT